MSTSQYSPTTPDALLATATTTFKGMAIPDGEIPGHRMSTILAFGGDDDSMRELGQETVPEHHSATMVEWAASIEHQLIQLNEKNLIQTLQWAINNSSIGAFEYYSNGEKQREIKDSTAMLLTGLQKSTALVQRILLTFMRGSAVVLSRHKFVDERTMHTKAFEQCTMTADQATAARRLFEAQLIKQIHSLTGRLPVTLNHSDNSFDMMMEHEH